MTGRRILVVEDEMIVQLHLSRIVEEQGHDLVGVASNMEEALQIARNTQPELVLMDIHLANGSDGVETARALIDEIECAVVFISAYADEATVARTEEVGAAGYLVKPFTATQVRAAISTAFASHARLYREREQVRSLGGVLESVGGPLFLVDSDNRVSFANQSAADLVGRPVYMVFGRDLFSVMGTDTEAGELADAVASARRAGSGACKSLVVRDCEGRDRIVDVVIEAMRVDKGASDSLLLSLTDRTVAAQVPTPGGETVAEPFGDGTRLLVFSHDTFGLGHLRRSIALIRGLCARYPGLSVLLVTGSPMVHRFAMPPGVDYVKLPALQKVGVEDYSARTLQIPDADIHELRANLILHTARDYRPNALLVDHAPEGSKGELRPTLEWLEKRGGCVRILGLRDVVDSPEAVCQHWQDKGIYDLIERHYDHLAVYGDASHFDVVGGYRLPPAIASRVTYMDYICSHDGLDKVGLQSSDPQDQQPVVAVTIGGGDGGGGTVVVPFLQMMRRFADRIDFRAEIILGPLVDHDTQLRCRELAQGLPVKLHQFVESTGSLLRRAEVVISTAGYNTVTDILSLARRWVVIPRVLYREEQRIRAQMLHDRGLCGYIDPEDVTPERLFDAIAEVRQDEPLVRARQEGLGLEGVQRFVRFCSGIKVEVPASVRGEVSAG